MDDYAASTSTTGMLYPFQVYPASGGRLEEAEDHDWFRVELTAGRNYVFEGEGYMVGRTPGVLAHPRLTLRDASGAIVASADDGGSGKALLGVQAAASGVFYIDMSSAEPLGNIDFPRQYIVLLKDLDQGRFEPPSVRLGAFGASNAAGSWSSFDQYPRLLGDITGEGRADIVGFGSYYAALGAFGWSGGLQGGGELTRDFTAIDGWSSEDRFPRRLADVNGDGRADIVGFGEDGVWVALSAVTPSRGDYFDDDRITLRNFGASASAGGWTSDDRHHRTLADLNGDGRADIVGFGDNGVWVALADGTGDFGESRLTHANFGASAEGGGWSSDDRYHREMADVNGDGFADIVGFGEAGVWVALGDGTGGFGQSRLVMQDFGVSQAAGGWVSDDRYPRRLGDVNGDGFADIVGFGEDGVWVALADGTGGFAPSRLERNDFGASAAAGGWSSQNLYPRALGDMNGDGRADIVGFGIDGVSISWSYNIDNLTVV